MIYFDCDYMAGAHPEVMARLNETNLLHTTGYGSDPFSSNARKIILDACGIANGEVYFFEGGTQTNTVVIDRLLDKNDGVVCCETAHINIHEAGAIEACGHKVITLPSHEGKVDSSELKKLLDDYNRDDTNQHMVRPAMVYISFPTELGTIYSRDELCDLHSICNKAGIPLYIDGARLAYGLAASDGNLSIKDIAALADVFYIGGTKCGALFGEAVVTRNPGLLPRFFSLMKLRGAVLAKGRLLGVQFETLFTDNLYHRIGHHAVKLALRLKEGFIDKGYKPFVDSPSNQQFFVLSNEKIKELSKVASFELWGPLGEKETPVRFVTDWSTRAEDIDEIIGML